jgi:hypothetical protein
VALAAVWIGAVALDCAAAPPPAPRHFSGSPWKVKAAVLRTCKSLKLQTVSLSPDTTQIIADGYLEHRHTRVRQPYLLREEEPTPEAEFSKRLDQAVDHVIWNTEDPPEERVYTDTLQYIEYDRDKTQYVITTSPDSDGALVTVSAGTESRIDDDRFRESASWFLELLERNLSTAFLHVSTDSVGQAVAELSDKYRSQIVLNSRLLARRGWPLDDVLSAIPYALGKGTRVPVSATMAGTVEFQAIVEAARALSEMGLDESQLTRLVRGALARDPLGRVVR